MGIILSASIIENLLYDRHCSSRPLAYIIFQSFQETCKEGIRLPDLQMRKPGLLKGRYPWSLSCNPQGPGRDLHAYGAWVCIPCSPCWATLPPLQVGFQGELLGLWWTIPDVGNVGIYPLMLSGQFHLEKAFSLSSLYDWSAEAVAGTAERTQKRNEIFRFINTEPFSWSLIYCLAVSLCLSSQNME